jgi:tRNA pseudouridine38-40 synthase
MKVRLLVSYDGSCFSGFARNQGVVTVAETLEEYIGAICRTPVTITGAGRTDKGVHAYGQVVSFDGPDDLDLARLQRSLNSRGAGRLVVREVVEEASSFDARFSATWRRYRYTIINSAFPDVASRHTSWHVHEPLSVEAMEQACAPLVGLHDFACFCRRPKRDDGIEVSLVRSVTAAGWKRGAGHELIFEITASAFCQQMVRSIVGTLVDVGRGQLTAASMVEILRRGDRQRAGQVAPPWGLSLYEVGY